MKTLPTQKKVIFWLILISIGYFALMIPPNMTGAKTPEMLSIFEVDEFAQYPHLLRMLSSGDTTYQSIRNFTVYLHYFYGYPFYFTSALSLLPLKIISGSDWSSQTNVIVAWLRQMVSVLPMILSIWVFTWIGTRFRSVWLSCALFIFLLTLPAVIINNFWWHPDSLSLLFIALVLLFLEVDSLRFGRFYLFAGLFCGFAAGIKLLGLYFALAIPVYLVLGWLAKKISARKALLSAVLFILALLCGLLISNPLLILPQERAEIIQTQKTLFEETSSGIFTFRDKTLLENGRIPVVLQENFAQAWFFCLSLIALALALISPKQRTMALVLLGFLLFAFGAPIISGSRRLHYFLPAVIPLFAILPNLIYACVKLKTHWVKNILCIGLIALFSFQFALNLRTDVNIYQEQLNRETNAPAIQLYDQIMAEIIPDLSANNPERMVRIFRDWKIYFPHSDGLNVQMDWDMPILSSVTAFDPDLILIEQANIAFFTDPDTLDTAVNTARMPLIVEYYRKAQENKLDEYELIIENNFAKVFRKK